MDCERNLVPPKDTGLVRQCQDDSHAVLCKDISMATMATRTTKGGRITLTPGCSVDVCQEYLYPTCELSGSGICLNWTAHLPLGRSGSEWPITAAALRPRLTELRDNAGRFIRPPLAAGVGMDFPELRCFDLTDCDCIVFEDSQYILESTKAIRTPKNACFPWGDYPPIYRGIQGGTVEGDVRV